jgi:hypothetical protein
MATVGNFRMMNLKLLHWRWHSSCGGGGTPNHVVITIRDLPTLDFEEGEEANLKHEIVDSRVVHPQGHDEVKFSNSALLCFGHTQAILRLSSNYEITNREK